MLDTGSITSTPGLRTIQSLSRTLPVRTVGQGAIRFSFDSGVADWTMLRIFELELFTGAFFPNRTDDLGDYVTRTFYDDKITFSYVFPTNVIFVMQGCGSDRNSTEFYRFQNCIGI